MQARPTSLHGVFMLEPKVFGDERGYFYESFNQREFEAAIGESVQFVQDNHSKSAKGVLRGLHYQLAPHAQGKLVRVTQGEVFDVVVDLRKDSPSFGQWLGELMSAESRQQLWIPAGLAHGFLVVSETAELLYKTTDYYQPALERCLRWDDPALSIAWPLEGALPLLSEKDRLGISLAEV
jgi:dTDP-4-dehydrorhamnose 3,5-epimerase